MRSKTHLIHISVTPEEKQCLKDISHFMSMNMSEYIRSNIPTLTIELPECPYYKNGMCINDSSIGLCRFIECPKKNTMERD